MRKPIGNSDSPAFLVSSTAKVARAATRSAIVERFRHERPEAGSVLL